MNMRYHCMVCACEMTMDYIPGTCGDNRGEIDVQCPACNNGMGHFEWHHTEYRYYPKHGMFYSVDGNIWVCP